MKYIGQNYLKYNKGSGYICGHVEALHAMQPSADVFTDKIAEKLMKKTGCAGIISTVSREHMDLNRSPNKENDPAIQEYRKTIKEIVQGLEILDHERKWITHPYLHLSFHGMKDSHYGPYGIEVGTVHGQSCSAEIRDWFKESLLKKAQQALPEAVIVFDQLFVGDKSITYHRLGDGDSYLGYGDHFHSFQIELSRTIRGKHRTKIIDIFARLMLEFQNRPSTN